MNLAITILIITILFFATFIRSAFGFGEALIAVPLLALIIPVEVAAPVAILVSITVAAIVVMQDWRYIHFKSAFGLIVFSLAGIPVGIFLLMWIPEGVIKAFLAVIIIAFSVYSLRAKKRVVLNNDIHPWPFGFAAGILGGTYGMNGPPLVMYGILRSWTPQHFRATLQGYFLPASILIMIGYKFTGLWSAEVTSHFLTALPAILLAIFIGRTLNQRINAASFLRLVHIGLILIGVILFWQSVS